MAGEIENISPTHLFPKSRILFKNVTYYLYLLSDGLMPSQLQNIFSLCNQVFSWRGLNCNIFHNQMWMSWIFQKYWLFKGQLNSELSRLNNDVIVCPKMPTKNFKDFCPTKQIRIIAIAKKLPTLTKKSPKESATILVCLVGQKSL